MVCLKLIYLTLSTVPGKYNCYYSRELYWEEETDEKESIHR